MPTEKGLRPKLVFMFPGMNMGGAERHAIDLLRRLRPAGYEIGLVVHGRRGTPHMEAILRAEGAVVLNIKGMSSPIGWVKSWRELRQQDADVIVCVNQSVAIVAAVLRRLGLIRSRVMCIFHTTKLQANDRKRFFLFEWIAPYLDSLVYVSETQQQYWENAGLKCPRGVSIRNGIDMDRFILEAIPATATRESVGLTADDYVIGIVAQLRPEKNHEELIDALALARKTEPSAKVLIIGGGDRQDAVQRHVAALGLVDHVIFAGEQTDVRPLMRLCDVCVLCSTTETLPLVALEVLAIGAPLVSSDVGAMSSVITDGTNGYLYPPGQPDQLAERLVRLADPVERQRMSANARPSVLKYDIREMVSNYVSLIESLVSTAA